MGITNYLASGKLMGMVLIGSAVGAAVGILFSPNKGSRLRKKLVSEARDTAGELKTKIRNRVNEFKEKFEDAKEDATLKFKDLKRTGKQKVHNLKQQPKPAPVRVSAKA